MNRVGIVPEAGRTTMADATEVATADGFQFPANNGVTDTNVVYHGGATAPNIPVQLIFWGASWNSTHVTLCQQIISAAQNLIDGPFASAVDQYGIAAPVFRGAVRSPRRRRLRDMTTAPSATWCGTASTPTSSPNRTTPGSTTTAC